MEYVLAPRLLVKNGDAMVKLGEDARQCVVYLGYEGPGDDQIEPEGTGFIIRHGGRSPNKETERAASYLVTARHVAKKLGADPFVIRMNHVMYPAHGHNIHIDGAEWHWHPDGEAVDVALMEFDPPEWAGWVPFDSYGFLVPLKLGQKAIQAGDLAYVVGVYPLLHGDKRNLPIVHTGNIALMPEDELIPVFAWEEPTHDKNGEPRIVYVRGYLVEANTHPGSSGSPVFVRRSIEQRIPELGDQKPVETWFYGSRWLLGVWQGSWGDDLAQFVSTPGGEATKPFGMGVVIPAPRILEILEMDELVERRRAAKLKQDRSRALKPQSASDQTGVRATNPNHKEDFTALLNAASKKNPPAD